MEAIEINEEMHTNEFNDQLLLPKYVYAPIYVRHLNEIKKSGLTPDMSNLSWSDKLNDFVFLTSNIDYAGKLALLSDKVGIECKDSVFILKINTKNLNRHNIFIYNESDNHKEHVFVYLGTIPYSIVEIAFSYN
jgi:hypothetical protein